MSDFKFSLTDEEKSFLKDLVKKSVKAKFADDPGGPPKPPTRRLEERFGAFVTLKLDGRLRGCIGHIIGDRPLYMTIWDMARAAAFGDPRFVPMTEEEFDRVEVEITILSPLEPVPDVNQIEPGRHGLLVKRGMNQGLLLPQVAVEWGWTRERFLEQTCYKAGLPGNAWREPDTEIYWFEGVVF